ncbi:hypothetical protein H4R33_003449 [Dimargaris cristalligena]|uniref:Uncharacterized protein n=1 Tax=Dimargaris cristalligena TaxID=215637 RepID=A0A4P9ZYQ7_9FUNG|nr:hypothetical protein H4R33_003449 [Dimargaris cristalligena]RKP38884.1 hypothetical protein BJ085DRAFT_40836 [Dimargaris cristalligena]|eukprot:RKP38884.1 hypothetical protein BJ085DRAFT_40836 [Dimargaris cristalligena]
MDFIDEQTEKELIGESILIDRQLSIDYDRRRNSNREALRSIQKGGAKETKSWMSLGDIFIKLPHPTAQELIQEDQKKIDAEISEIRDRIRENTQKLEKLDAAESRNRKQGTFLSGYNLKPISSQELYNIGEPSNR